MTDSAAVAPVSDELFQNEVVKCPLPAVVVFEKSCWGTAHIMKPILQKIATDYFSKIRVFKYDLDKNSIASTLYGIEETFNILVFNKGNLVYRSGVISNHEFREIIDKYLDESIIY